MRKFTWLLMILSMLIFGLSACGGGGGGGENDGNTTPTASEDGEIGPAGGYFELNDQRSNLDGTKIEIPEGALAVTKKFEIKPASLDGDIYFKNTKLIAVEFGPDGTVFNEPVKITLPYDESLNNEGKVCIYYFNEAENSWEKIKLVSVDETNNLATGETSHLSKYVVATDKNEFSISLLKDGFNKIHSNIKLNRDFRVINLTWVQTAYNAIMQDATSIVTPIYKIILYKKNFPFDTQLDTQYVWFDITNISQNMITGVKTYDLSAYVNSELLFEQRDLNETELLKHLTSDPVVFKFDVNAVPGDEYYIKCKLYISKNRTASDYFTIGEEGLINFATISDSSEENSLSITDMPDVTNLDSNEDRIKDSYQDLLTENLPIYRGFHFEVSSEIDSNGIPFNRISWEEEFPNNYDLAVYKSKSNSIIFNSDYIKRYVNITSPFDLLVEPGEKYYYTIIRNNPVTGEKSFTKYVSNFHDPEVDEYSLHVFHSGVYSGLHASVDNMCAVLDSQYNVDSFSFNDLWRLNYFNQNLNVDGTYIRRLFDSSGMAVQGGVATSTQSLEYGPNSSWPDQTCWQGRLYLPDIPGIYTLEHIYQQPNGEKRIYYVDYFSVYDSLTGIIPSIYVSKDEYHDHIEIKQNDGLFGIGGSSKYKVWISFDNGNTYNILDEIPSVDGSFNSYDYVTSSDNEIYFKVQACNSENNCGPFSNADFGSISTVQVPAGVNATKEVYTNKVIVSWDIIEDSTASYVVYKRGYPIGEVVNSSQFEDFFDYTEGDDNLNTYLNSPSDSWTYTVRARTTAGMSPYSASDKGSLLLNIPPPPSSITLTPGGYTATISWPAVSGANEYQVFGQQDGGSIDSEDNGRISNTEITYNMPAGTWCFYVASVGGPYNLIGEKAGPQCAEFPFTAPAPGTDPDPAQKTNIYLRISTIGVADAFYTISGPSAPAGGWYGNMTISDALPGTYTVTYEPLTGYVTPAPITKTVSDAGSYNFIGAYYTQDLGDVTVTKSANVQLKLYDHFTVDGDMIDVYLNGQRILSNYLLIGDPPADTININLNSGANTLSITALNEGSVSPNTATLEVSEVVNGDPVKVYEINSGDTAGFKIFAP